MVTIQRLWGSAHDNEDDIGLLKVTDGKGDSRYSHSSLPDDSQAIEVIEL